MLPQNCLAFKALPHNLAFGLAYSISAIIMIALAAAMFLTRRVDWYKSGRGAG